MAELIQRTDDLNTGREKLNNAILDAEDAKQKSDHAVNVSEQAKQIAQTAENKADNVQEQFNQVVIEGDSSVEAAQARVDAEGKSYPTLKARLDAKETEFSSQLVQNMEEIRLRGLKPELYGAVGDGVTDDTVALQKALDESVELGTFVLLSEKTYCYSQLIFPAGVDIRGLKQNSSVLKHIGSGISMLSGTTGNNLYLKLSNFRIDLNPQSTIGVDLSGCAMYRIENITLFSNGSQGIGFKLGRGDELVKAGYYNTFFNCYLNGDSPEGRLEHGFYLTNSANSNRFYDIRFDYVKNPVFINEHCNNNNFYGCAFENFQTGLISKGRSTFVSGCRFENQESLGYTDTIAVNIQTIAYYNSVIGCHFQNVTQKIVDDSDFKLNVYFNDAVTYLHEVEMNNKALRDASTIGLHEHTSFVNPNNGELVYLNDGTNKGLYFREGTALRPISFVRASSTAGRPTGVPVGTMFFDNTLQKPIWWNGSVWKDATGATV